MIPATNCSFPFTYLGKLYYSCVQTIFDPANVCNKIICVADHRNLALCSSQTGSHIFARMLCMLGNDFLRDDLEVV